MKFFKKKEAPRERRSVGGSGQRPAFSYYAGDQRAKIDTVRERNADEKKRRIGRGVRLIPTIIAVGAILVSVVYNTTLSSSPYIVFAGDASPYRAKEYYQSKSEDILQSSVKNKSKLTLNVGRTETALLEEFNEFDVVRLTMPIIGRRPTLTAHVRQPALLLATTTNIFVVDGSGKVVVDANALPSSAKEKLLSVKDQSGLAVSVGAQVLTSETVAFIKEMAHQFTEKQMVITEVVLPTTPNEVDIRIKDLKYFVRADTMGNARLQAGAFFAVKDSGVAPSEYVDVRVEEKVFYK